MRKIFGLVSGIGICFLFIVSGCQIHIPLPPMPELIVSRTPALGEEGNVVGDVRNIQNYWDFAVVAHISVNGVWEARPSKPFFKTFLAPDFSFEIDVIEAEEDKSASRIVVSLVPSDFIPLPDRLPPAPVVFDSVLISRARSNVSAKPPNHAPVASSQNLTASQDTAVSLSLLASDQDNDTLFYRIVSQPQHGVLSGNLPVSPNLIYTPAKGFVGEESFSFAVSDGKTESGPAVVLITILPLPNRPPTAIDQSLTTSINTAIPLVLGATDPDNDQLTYNLLTYPSNGILSGIFPNLTYTPVSGFSGQDNFTFQAEDGQFVSNVARVVIVVR